MIDEIAEKTLKVRDKIAEIKERHKNELAPYNEALERMENLLLAQLNQLGASSIKTAHGTVYKSSRTSSPVADWPLFLDYIRKHEEWDLLERRASKSAVEQFKSLHEDELPPGVDWREEITVNIRRS